VTRPVVTFDLFSALVDSRTGGAAALGELARRHGWEATGEQLYDAWDPRNKAAQRDCPRWAPWRVPARQAVVAAYAEVGVVGDPDEALEVLVGSMPDWPLWPDVPEGLTALAGSVRVGLLSNVDDALFARTAASSLVDAEVALTSERLGAYKPQPEIYVRARERLGDVVHVPTSARDVRGALEAGIPVVRLRRPGHELDPDGPRPEHEVDSIDEIAELLAG
jgi:2-haloacid dehalogenase